MKPIRWEQVNCRGPRREFGRATSDRLRIRPVNCELDGIDDMVYERRYVYESRGAAAPRPFSHKPDISSP